MIDWLGFIVCAGLVRCEPHHCNEVTHREKQVLVCSYRTDQVTIRTHLRSDQGEEYAYLDRLADALEATDQEPQMVMNGGMYHADLEPVGLYVERGGQVTPLSTRDGPGNFHLLPNGVFWLEGQTAHVAETRAFARKRVKPDFATQSGPMLVIDGKLHPRFLVRSDSEKIRNGVGVSANGREVHFAISLEPLNFHTFGTLFRDLLETPNALFLDGTISGIRAEGYNIASWRPLGPMISVTARGNKDQ